MVDLYISPVVLIKNTQFENHFFLYRPKLNIFALTIAELYKPILLLHDSQFQKIFHSSCSAFPYIM